MTVDPNGDLYFCERGEAYLWKLTFASGIITVIAGSLHACMLVCIGFKRSLLL
jgi:hypothetical protein